MYGNTCSKHIFIDLHHFLKEHFLNMGVYGLWVTICAIVKALGHCEEWILHIGVHAIWGILEHQLHKFLHIWFYLRSSDAGSTQVVVATIMCLTIITKIFVKKIRILNLSRHHILESVFVIEIVFVLSLKLTLLN